MVKERRVVGVVYFNGSVFVVVCQERTVGYDRKYDTAGINVVNDLLSNRRCQKCFSIGGNGHLLI